MPVSSDVAIDAVAGESEGTMFCHVACATASGTQHAVGPALETGASEETGTAGNGKAR